MRIFLFGPPTEQLKQTAVRLSYSGYTVDFFTQRPSAGEVSEARLREQLMTAMLNTEAVVLHDSLVPSEVKRLAVVCEFIRKPLVRVHHLPDQAPEDGKLNLRTRMVQPEPLDVRSAASLLTTHRGRVRIKHAVARAKALLLLFEVRMNRRVSGWVSRNAMKA